VSRPATTALTLSPILLVTLAACAGMIGQRHRAARVRGLVPSRSRAASGAVGVALLIVAFVSPVATLAAHYLLALHLVQVTLVMGFAPPLLLLALPPRSSQPRLPGWLRRAGTVLVHPAVAIVLVNAVFFGWHAPIVYQACLEHEELYSLQMASLLGVSLVFWWPIVEPHDGGRWSLTSLYKLGYILLATIPQTFAGLLFALAHRPFYPGYASAARLAGMDPLTDQQVAGACMALVSKLALFAAFSVVMWRMLDPHGIDGDAGDDGGPPDDHDDDAPQPVRPRAPAWLGMLERGPVIDEPAMPRRERVLTP
jgi:putative membrane protein